MLQTARSTSTEAEPDHKEPARLRGEAAALVPANAIDEKGGSLLRQACALQYQGDERGDNAALRKALQVHDRALTAMTREHAHSSTEP
jgi:hypothetical protein